MIRLYQDIPLSEGQELLLTENAHRYLTRVMRQTIGDELLLFNGRDGEWLARIEEISKKETRIILENRVRPQKEEGDLWLLFSPLKPKRMEFLVEKATELGASTLWPIQVERTTIPKANLEKMKNQVIEAAEQCERLTIPEIKPLTRLGSMLETWPTDRILLYGDESLNSAAIKDFPFTREKKYAFLVGPEGGFSPQEFEALRQAPFVHGVTLTANILRAETAALAGLSYIQATLL